MNPQTIDFIIRRAEVEKLTGLCKSSIYEKMADGSFPQPCRLTKRSVGWRASDIQRWLQSLAPRGA